MLFGAQEGALVLALDDFGERGPLGLQVDHLAPDIPEVVVADGALGRRHDHPDALREVLGQPELHIRLIHFGVLEELEPFKHDDELAIKNHALSSHKS